jgi:hypothetical protein
MSQMDLIAHAAARDRALDLLEEKRSGLVSIAREIALRIAKEKGRVTSSEVISALRDSGYGDAIDRVDKRFMGAVFRSNKGWSRIGFENAGSHRRPISIWRLR